MDKNFSNNKDNNSDQKEDPTIDYKTLITKIDNRVKTKVRHSITITPRM